MFKKKMVHSLHGLENAVISKYAYAIEYDAIDAMQIKPSLETKIISGLFTADKLMELRVMKKLLVKV